MVKKKEKWWLKPQRINLKIGGQFQMLLEVGLGKLSIFGSTHSHVLFWDLSPNTSPKNLRGGKLHADR